MHLWAHVATRPFLGHRRDSDTEAYWMAGHPKAVYFWILQRDNLFGEPVLRKVAGEYKARVDLSAMWFTSF